VQYYKYTVFRVKFWKIRKKFEETTNVAYCKPFRTRHRLSRSSDSFARPKTRLGLGYFSGEVNANEPNRIEIRGIRVAVQTLHDRTSSSGRFYSRAAGLLWEKRTDASSEVKASPGMSRRTTRDSRFCAIIIIRLLLLLLLLL